MSAHSMIGVSNVGAGGSSDQANYGKVVVSSSSGVVQAAPVSG
jgi:hypothetical protein